MCVSRYAHSARRVLLANAGLVFLLLLLVPTKSVGEPNVPCVVTVPDAGVVTLSDGLVESLWEWCRADGACRKAYHQSEVAPNRTVFQHLLPPDVVVENTRDADVYASMRRTLCGGTVEASNRALWVQRLVAHRRTMETMCDLNHELRFDEPSMRSMCVCRADRVCTDFIYDPVPFYLALGLIMVASGAFMGGSVYKNVVIVRKLSESTGDTYADTSALLSALT